MAMLSEKQYLDLYQSSSRIIKKNSAEVLNAVRDAAFEDFRRLGFPSRKVERYKYTDMSAIFEPDYGLNLNRLEIPVDPYQAFRCDVPNLSTSLYFVVNDAFYCKALPKVELPEGVIVDSLNKIAAENPEFIGRYYACQNRRRWHHGIEYIPGTGWLADLCSKECKGRANYSGHQYSPFGC